MPCGSAPPLPMGTSLFLTDRPSWRIHLTGAVEGESRRIIYDLQA